MLCILGKQVTANSIEYHNKRLTLSHIEEICSRRLWTHFVKKWKISKNWKDNQWLKVENYVAKGETAHDQFLLLLQGFQTSSASEASESVYIREGVKFHSKKWRI